MNFKSIGLAGVAAATLMTAATLTIAPANAANLAGSYLTFAGDGKFDIPTNRLNFYPFSGGNFSIPGISGTSSSSNFGFAKIGDTSKGVFDYRGGEKFRIKDLDFTAVTPGTSWKLASSSVGNFLKFKGGVTFDLLTFNLNKVVSRDGNGKPILSGNGTPIIFIVGDYTGTFADAAKNPILGLDGTFSSQFSRFTSGKGTTYSSDITAIPTPALLPSLLGLGVAAIRKRKSEESGVEAVETAKA